MNDMCFNNVNFSMLGIVKQSKLYAWDMLLTEESFHGVNLDPMNAGGLSHIRGMSSLMWMVA